MKLVETDADRPEDETEPAPVSTPPRPEKRRAYASLIFTLVTLVGTVVTIYTVFPARVDETADAAVATHRRTNPSWQIAAPDRKELAAWATGVLDATPPLPSDGGDVQALGGLTLDIRHRPAAYVRYTVQVGGVAYPVSYVVQHAEDSPAGRASRVEDADDVESWRDATWAYIAVGPAASSASAWKSRIGVP